MMKLNSEEMGWRLTMGSYDLQDISLMWQTRKSLEIKRTFLVTRYPKEAALKYGFSYVTRNFEDALSKAFEEKGKDATISSIYQEPELYPYL